MMKKIVIFCIVFTVFLTVKAQNVFYRMDFGTNNIYAFTVGNLATAGLNAATNSMLFDNAYTYTSMSVNDKVENVSTKQTNVLGLTAREIFSDITLGGKLGYQSFYPTTFNWGVFASAHYRINQFGTIQNDSEKTFHHNVQRAQLGGGLLFMLGSIETSTCFIVEAGLRYEVPLSYKGPSGLKTKDMLNSGFSSHFALRVNGNGALQGLGVYADIPHYDLFKKTGATIATPNLKMYTFGIIYTITPWEIKRLY